MKRQGLLRTAFILFPAAVIAGSMICAASEVSTDVFRVTIPDEIAQICRTEITEHGIDFFHKESSEKRMGGFVSSIAVYEKLSDYGMMPSFRRGGEIDLKDGTRLDVVLQKPTDVQFYPEDQESYHELAQAIEMKILPSIEPLDGAVYIPQDQVDTTWIFDEVLENLVTALKERTDRDGLEEKGFSYVYAYTYDQEQDPLDLIGYTFIDVNNDGYKELLLGSVGDPAIYDMFVWVDGKAENLFSSGERSMHYLMAKDGIMSGAVCLEASGGAALHETSFSYVESDTTDSLIQAKFILDYQKDEENPWFIDYGFSSPEAYDEETWNTRMGNFGDRFNVTYEPLSGLALD